MTACVTYRDSTYALRFIDWNSMERYLLKWISKPVNLVVHFESLTEQSSYFHDFEVFYQSVIGAQRRRGCGEWVIYLYGFDNQPYAVDWAA